MKQISFYEIEQQACALLQRETAMRVNLQMMKMPHVPIFNDDNSSESDVT